MVILAVSLPKDGPQRKTKRNKRLSKYFPYDSLRQPKIKTSTLKSLIYRNIGVHAAVKPGGPMPASPLQNQPRDPPKKNITQLPEDLVNHRPVPLDVLPPGLVATKRRELGEASEHLNLGGVDLAGRATLVAS